MAQTYCGKSCADCVKKEELKCPGCRVGPGKSLHGECELAQCCRSRGHETCETCNFGIRCGKYMRREQAPYDRLKRMNAEQVRMAETAKRTPAIAHWMRVLFWLVIPNLIGSLFTNDTFKGLLPGFYIPGLILQYCSSVAYCVVLFIMSKLEYSYRKAGIYMLIGLGVSALSTLAGSSEDVMVLRLLLVIPAIIINFLSAFHKFRAHSDVMAEVDLHISEKWTSLWKAYIVVYAMVYGGVFAVVISPVLGFFAMLIGAIGAVILGIVEEVLLYKSAKCADLFGLMAPEA